jgi:hypothetical protein
MKEHYKVFFGFKKDPLSQDIRVEDMMRSASLMGVKERFLYTVNLGAIAVITGDVGSGKSSALRFASSTLHPLTSPVNSEALNTSDFCRIPQNYNAYRLFSILICVILTFSNIFMVSFYSCNRLHNGLIVWFLLPDK